MKDLIAMLLCAVVFLVIPLDTRAEGRCPPGQYPVGGQGVLGCAPIPGYGNQGVGAPSAPAPNGRWGKTWGAFAESVSSGLVGVSVGEMSKDEAEQVALKRCASEGDRDCEISFSYENQCAAIAHPSSGKGRAHVASAATEEEAFSIAIAKCIDTGGGKCVRFYSDCSKPVFIPY